MVVYTEFMNIFDYIHYLNAKNTAATLLFDTFPRLSADALSQNIQ